VAHCSGATPTLDALALVSEPIDVCFVAPDLVVGTPNGSVAPAANRLARIAAMHRDGEGLLDVIARLSRRSGGVLPDIVAEFCCAFDADSEVRGAYWRDIADYYAYIPATPRRDHRSLWISIDGDPYVDIELTSAACVAWRGRDVRVDRGDHFAPITDPGLIVDVVRDWCSGVA
jgi:pimeloyl-ACP methyl ester carboxylesterase